MKKAFGIVSLTIYSFGLIIGLGFAVVGEVNGSNKLIGDKVALAHEVASLEVEQQTLMDTMVAERKSHQKELALSLSMAGRLILPMPQTYYQIGQSPHQE